MKSQKLTLKTVKNVLSRAEMKVIMAGSGGGGGKTCYVSCSSQSEGVAISDCSSSSVEAKCGSADNATCNCY